MEKEAILHIPLSQFAFAEKEDRLVIRIRCKGRFKTVRAALGRPGGNGRATSGETK